MARLKNPFIPPLLMLAVVVAGLVGYTYHQTGEFHIWPSLVGEKDPILSNYKKQFRENEKRIGKLRARLAMSMGGIPRDEVEQEIEDLEDRNLELKIKIDRR